MADVPAEVELVAKLVNQRIAQLLEEQRRVWIGIDLRLVDVVDELARMAAGGKRLRAAFCYHSWVGAGGNPADAHATSQIVDAGAAFELLQTFALIHDDIMDNAATRRGEQTIHHRHQDRVTAQQWRGDPRRYGEGVAILVGDLSHVYADQLIGSASPAVRRLWDELRIELNMGQYLDMRSAVAGEIDRQTAQRVATFKSALYTIVRPLQLGAAIAKPEADPALHDHLEAFGRPVGQAFQLRDDLLGVFGDAAAVGKPVGDDLREGKVTELVAVAVANANKAQQEVLADIGSPNLSPADLEAIIAVLRETGAVTEIERRIESLIATSANVLATLPFESEARNTLEVLANYVAARTH